MCPFEPQVKGREGREGEGKGEEGEKRKEKEKGKEREKEREGEGEEREIIQIHTLVYPFHLFSAM